MPREFIDSYGVRGRPKLKSAVSVVGKSIQLELLDGQYFRLSLPSGRSIKVSQENARRLAYWILDHLDTPKQRVDKKEVSDV